jgi:DNA-binding NtrC family response regulator
MVAIKVLIVDDEEEFSGAVAERLRNRDYDVDTAISGAEGLDKIKAVDYDAVLLDLTMPEMDGMETMQHMLEYDDQLQIIILTGYGSVQGGVDAIKKGAADFLEKPADIDALSSKLEEAHEKREADFEKDLLKKVSDLMKGKSW